MPKEVNLNVLGQPLVPCSFDPLTGFYRDGCCKTDDNDHGRHLVCANSGLKLRIISFNPFIHLNIVD